MGQYAVLRKRRRDPITKECDILFEKAMQEQDYKKASQILLYNVLKVYGVNGIMGALYDANSYMRRKRFTI